MRSFKMTMGWKKSVAAAFGLAAWSAAPVSAQVNCCPPPPCPQIYGAPNVAMPTTPGAPSTGTPDASAAAQPMSPSIGAEGSSLALSGSNVAMAAPGYVDFAIPITQFRLRVDSAYGNNRPDRAEFFYGKCGCFAMLPPNDPARDPNAPGPPLIETNVDYQELRPYFEYAFTNRWSAFIEAPIRFINPDQNANEAGFGNLIAGTKYALVACPDRYLTAQFLVSTPTADVDRGLGNQLVGLEPGMLWFQQLTDRLAIHAEVRDWIPIGGTDFQGNILRTGGAMSYVLYNSCNFRIIPISEVVSWWVLGGQELAVANPGNPNGVGAVVGVQDADGDTIVNAKIGVRLGFGQLVGPANISRSEIYIGYGRALTGDVWYKDMFRVEAAWRF